MIWAILQATHPALARQDFRVHPYVQHPTTDGMSVRWVSEDSVEAHLAVSHSDGSTRVYDAAVRRAEALAYDPWEIEQFFSGVSPPPLFLYSVRVDGLDADTRYPYEVHFGAHRLAGSFRTAPAGDRPLRLIVYGDPETEPESVGLRGLWPDPLVSGSERTYLIDQDQGYRENLAIIRSREPDLVLIVGDLVRIGQEQRDWDAFWTYNTAEDPDRSLAGQVPVLAVPGNHEYLSPHAPGGQTTYGNPQAEASISRFVTYFEAPDNGAPVDAHRGRYWRLDYGPVTLIGLDTNNNGPNGSDWDTNLWMESVSDGAGASAPDFQEGSIQYEWLVDQLTDARPRSRFLFVLLHQVPYSTSVHGLPLGDGPGQSPLSGVAVRRLMPLFAEYGVDAVFAGHGEILERSEFEGLRATPGGVAQHTVHVIDVGIGGDDLRGPVEGLVNPNRRFLAALDAPEVWEDGRLVEGGAHYGHLEVNIGPSQGGSWEARIEPVYVFPLLDESASALLGTERRVYDDVVVVREDVPSGVGRDGERPAIAAGQLGIAPHPARGETSVQVGVSTGPREMIVADLMGRVVARQVIASDQDLVTLDVSGWSRGAYVVQVSGEAGPMRGVFVVR